jgi:DNA-binding transcriptional ArsR family regulator
MVVDKARHVRGVDRRFHALANATRRDIVARVLREDQSVSALARQYPMSFAAVQKHVAVLERAGMVTKRRHGREQLVRGDVASVREIATLVDGLETVWRERIGRMHDILDEDDGGATT